MTDALDPASTEGHPDPLVSIVVPLGRDSPYLGEALDSVRAQTYPHWELVIVDNGVTDPQAVQDLISGDPRMSLVTIDHGATAARAQNVGAGETAGELIAFLGDDDIWVPDRLSAHVSAHIAHPDAPASYCGLWYMDAEGNRFGIPWLSQQSSATDMIRGTAPTPFGETLVVTRRAWSAVGGYSPEVPTLEDFELPLRLALLGDLIYVEGALYGYRRHGGNITSTSASNVRLRRMVMDEMIRRQSWAAAARGQHETARLFAERLRRFRKQQSAEAGESTLRYARHSDVRGALRDARWAIAHSPSQFARGFGSTLVRKLRALAERSATPR